MSDGFESHLLTLKRRHAFSTGFILPTQHHCFLCRLTVVDGRLHTLYSSPAARNDNVILAIHKVTIRRVQ